MNALKTLNPYFWKHRILLFYGFFFIIASNFFNIFKVQFVGKSVDEISKTTNLGFNKQVLIYVGIIVGSSLLTGFFTFMMRQTILISPAGLKMASLLRMIPPTMPLRLIRTITACCRAKIWFAPC